MAMFRGPFGATQADLGRLLDSVEKWISNVLKPMQIRKQLNFLEFTFGCHGSRGSSQYRGSGAMKCCSEPQLHTRLETSQDLGPGPGCKLVLGLK